MNWLVFLFVVLLNTILCLLQYAVEIIDRRKGLIPSRHSIIPGTKQKFLYWEDFYTQTYGDFLGLVWIMNGFVHMALKGIPAWQWFILVAISIISVGAFVYMNLQSQHKPDWGYPVKGKISWGGIVHLPYFGALSGMTLLCLIHMINGSMQGILLYTTIGGMIIYLITVVLDIKSGHFDLKTS